MSKESLETLLLVALVAGVLKGAVRAVGVIRALMVKR